VFASWLYRVQGFGPLPGREVTATLKQFIPDDRLEKAPGLPTDRPPTRAEIWAHYHAIYFDLKGHAPSTLCTPRCVTKPEKELEKFAGDEWVWAYVYFYNFKGWRKQPEWLPGDPVVASGVPDQPFQSGAYIEWKRIVVKMIETVKAAA
jgi:hypothetical protein